MSEAASRTPTSLDMPDNAWGGRGFVAILRRLVGMLLIGIGGWSLVLAAQVAMEAPPEINGLKIRLLWPSVLQGLLTITVGAFVWRGNKSRIRTQLAGVMIAEAVLLTAGYFASVRISTLPWFPAL